MDYVIALIHFILSIQSTLLGFCDLVFELSSHEMLGYSRAFLSLKGEMFLFDLCYIGLLDNVKRGRKGSQNMFVKRGEKKERGISILRGEISN